jgi:aarF domain-containing kinase
VEKILEKELGGPLHDFFSSIDLAAPVGSASIAQVHIGTWRKTGEKVAIKVQYPNAEKLMIGDLKNLRVLAEFLQRTEFKFDLLSSIKELQKQIVNEFDFTLEAQNMDFMRKSFANSVNEVSIPKSIFSTKRALVMTFVDGVNLCKLAEFKTKKRKVSSFVEQKVGKKLLNVLAKAYGIMIFELNFFNADPHPGNLPD